MAKDKPLSPPGSPIFLVLGQSDVTKFRKGTSQLGVKHRIYTVQGQGYFRSRTLTIHKHVIMSWNGTYNLSNSVITTTLGSVTVV